MPFKLVYIESKFFLFDIVKLVEAAHDAFLPCFQRLADVLNLLEG
jgi:hypothetical protein